jgi:hypothetical protein
VLLDAPWSAPAAADFDGHTTVHRNHRPGRDKVSVSAAPPDPTDDAPATSGCAAPGWIGDVAYTALRDNATSRRSCTPTTTHHGPI